MHAHPTPLHPIIDVGPFPNWGIDFLTCNPHLSREQGYIILAVDYFTKWIEMPTYKDDSETTSIFVFSHIISWFEVPQAIVTDHGSYFRNHTMTDLTMKLGPRHDISILYYPQENGQVEVINKVLTTMIKRITGTHKR